MSEAVWQRTQRISGFDACFTRYVSRLLRRSFRTIWIQFDPDAFPAEGCIVAANHSSWWDGLVPYVFHHRRVADRQFAVMMSDDELRRFPFFRFGGAFSIDARSIRHARDAVIYAGELAAARTCVWIFPEGRIVNFGKRQRYGSGFVHAARYGAVPIVPAAMRFVMPSGQFPEAFLSFGAALDAQAKDAHFQTQASIESMLANIEAAIADDSIAPSFAPLFEPVPGIDARIASLLAAFRQPS